MPSSLAFEASAVLHLHHEYAIPVGFGVVSLRHSVRVWILSCVINGHMLLTMR